MEKFRRVRCDDWNLPPFCSGQIDVVVEGFENYQSLLNQRAVIQEDEVEVIERKRYSYPFMNREATNGYLCATEFELSNVEVEFLWIRMGDIFTRVYALEASLSQQNILGLMGDLELVFGNQFFTQEGNRLKSKVYHICDELEKCGHTQGGMVVFESKELLLEDYEKFDAESYHYCEWLECILGDAG